MTTSNTTNFNLTAVQLVNAALRKLSVLGDGQSPSSSQVTNGIEALNAMLKTFIAKGMPLWAISEYSLTLTSGDSYVLPVNPLKVLQAVLIDSTSGSHTPLNIKTHIDFNLLPTAPAGTPVNYWHEVQNRSSVFHVWPAPDQYSISNRTIKIVYQREFQDMVSNNDTLDFPSWWHEAVIYGLAHRLSGEFGIPLMDRQEFAKEAEYFLEEALSFGTEEGSLFLQPNWVAQR